MSLPRSRSQNVLRAVAALLCLSCLCQASGARANSDPADCAQAIRDALGEVNGSTPDASPNAASPDSAAVKELISKITAADSASWELIKKRLQEQGIPDPVIEFMRTSASVAATDDKLFGAIEMVAQFFAKTTLGSQIEPLSQKYLGLRNKIQSIKTDYAKYIPVVAAGGGVVSSLGVTWQYTKEDFWGYYRYFSDPDPPMRCTELGSTEHYLTCMKVYLGIVYPRLSMTVASDGKTLEAEPKWTAPDPAEGELIITDLNFYNSIFTERKKAREWSKSVILNGDALDKPVARPEKSPMRNPEFPFFVYEALDRLHPFTVKFYLPEIREVLRAKSQEHIEKLRALEAKAPGLAKTLQAILSEGQNLTKAELDKRKEKIIRSLDPKARG